MVKIHGSSLNSSDIGDLGSASESKTFNVISDTLQAQNEALPEKNLKTRFHENLKTQFVVYFNKPSA